MNRTLIIAVALALLAPMAHATDYVARIVVMDHTSFKPEYEAQMAPARTIVTPPEGGWPCLLYTSPSPRDGATSRMPSSA